MATPRARKVLVGVGVTGNLALLGYYKYAGFFVQIGNAVLGKQVPMESVVLPLAISFFTFQQIAYLVDAYRGPVERYSFVDYTVFVLFYPHFIAGPIVRHHEILPQLRSHRTFTSTETVLAVMWFSAGLFKKVFFADRVAPLANAVFDAAAKGEQLGFFDAWGGALAYTLQLYFDFSGYSDMAIAAALLFGVRFTLNFNSPYQASNIIDFWRRWHITLSNFLRDYLYIPLGGSRKGSIRRHTNLMVTMVLGGLWHGAGWNFLFWGGLHGAYLGVNHAWKATGIQISKAKIWGTILTFGAVVVAWVFFRATNWESAVSLVRSMAGANGWGSPLYLKGWSPWAHLAVLLTVCFAFPNTQRIFSEENGEAARWWRWQPSPRWAAFMGAVTGVGFVMILYRQNVVQEFLYFNF